MTKQNILFNRKRYEKVIDWCEKNGVVPQISKLRTGEQLQPGKGSYGFDVKRTGANIFGHTGLDRNDLFIPFGISICPVLDTMPRTGKKALMSYARRASVAADGFMTEDFEAFYNGKMFIRIDQTQANESFPCEMFKWIPETQPIISMDADGNPYAVGLQDQFDIENVMVPIVPAYLLQGTSDIRIDVDFYGVNADFSVATKDNPTQANANYVAHIDLIMIGVLVKGAADSSKINPLQIDKLYESL